MDTVYPFSVQSSSGLDLKRSDLKYNPRLDLLTRYLHSKSGEDWVKTVQLEDWTQYSIFSPIDFNFEVSDTKYNTKLCLQIRTLYTNFDENLLKTVQLRGWTLHGHSPPTHTQVHISPSNNRQIYKKNQHSYGEHSKMSVVLPPWIGFDVCPSVCYHSRFWMVFILFIL